MICFLFFINLEMTSDKTDIWHLLDLTNNTETNWFGTAQSLNGRWQIITREFQNLSLGQIILYSEKISILTILEISIKINKLHHCPFQGKCWRKSGLWTMSTIAIYQCFQFPLGGEGNFYLRGSSSTFYDLTHTLYLTHSPLTLLTK